MLTKKTRVPNELTIVWHAPAAATEDEVVSTGGIPNRRTTRVGCGWLVECRLRAIVAIKGSAMILKIGNFVHPRQPFVAVSTVFVYIDCHVSN